MSFSSYTLPDEDKVKEEHKSTDLGRVRKLDLAQPA
jgi:hypothetical protein